MSASTAPTVAPTHSQNRPVTGSAPGFVPDRALARTTGLLYLALGVAGLVGFLVLRPILVDADPVATAANLRDHVVLARLRIGAELALVLLQAVLALWFFRFFRAVDDVAAAAIAVFGTVNSVALMVSTAGLATGLGVALDAGDPATVQLMHDLSQNAWGVGNLFFGLWLIPMGICVLRSGSMPRLLGHLLVWGGGGYVLSAFVTILLPDAGVGSELLAMPATVGEFWMIGYLLVLGLRRARP